MSERKLKTRCYYTDYVNHMIRFYMITPDTLQMDRKRNDGSSMSKADIDNWIAVQSVIHSLKPEDKQMVFDIYKLHYRLPEAVKLYCSNTNTDERKTWVFITKLCATVAKRRGLI